MKTKFIAIASIIGAAGCFASMGMAAGPGKFDAPDDQALILPEFDRLHIEVPVAADLAIMNVRVFSPDNELLMSVRTRDQSVEFLVDSGLPDGEYRYETVSVFGNVDLTDRSKYVPGETFILRKFGSFRVSNGQIADKAQRSQEDVSLLDKVIKQSMRLAGVVLDVMIPSAQAASFSTAPDGDITIEDDSPSLIFDYGPLIGSTDGTSVWWIGAFEGVAATPDFTVKDITNGHNVLTFEQGTGQADSINVDTDGDIHWGGSGLNYDRGLQNLSIGTTEAGAEIVASATNPEIRLRDEDFSDYMFMNFDTFWFNIGYNGGSPITKVHFTAPASSLVVDGAGNLGVGAGTTPAASLEVRRTNGSARILVDEESATSATRTLFKLQNKGLTKFIIDNTTGAEWAFANKGTSFRISRQGSGAIEMEVFNNGDMTIDGALTQNSDVNAKTNIVAIDQDDILERITQMPISKWQYKDALGENHIGPMAQDFYAAFGLGHTDKGLSTIDTAGVALAAIQALSTENANLRKQVRDQNERLEALEAQQVGLQAMMTSLLEAQQASLVLTKTALN